LASWAEPGRWFRTNAVAQEDECLTTVTVPLETPPTGIAPHVENAVRGLFVLFDGYEFESRIIEGIVSNTLQREL
jgi:hypothetical protein